MHYGRIAARILAVAGLSVALILLLSPSGSSPWRALAGLLILTCPPVALVVSAIGVMRDERRVYALVTLLVSGAATFSLLLFAS